MKLRNARSTTYTPHFFSALCRSLFTNSCWIFATSLFVKEVGSKGYSQLFFFASLCALAYYIYFAIRGHKDKEPYNVYKAVLIVALVASAGCFLKPYFTFPKSINHLLLYFFVVSVMSVDLIGSTLGPMVLQASVNPAIFRQVYQKIITQELVARTIAAALVWLLSEGHLLVYLYPFAWSMLIAHFILFDITVWRMRVSALKTRIAEEDKRPAMESLSDSVRFVLSNPLVRVAMCIMAWATVSKFVLDSLFYQVADAQFSSARQMASFVSAMTISIYVISLGWHHIITRTINKRWQLSALLSVQPINILVLGGLALILPPFWPLVVLTVTYNLVHRSIQLPMSRQCLVPVPRKTRGTIVSLISMVVSVAALITSGAMAALKNALHLQDFLVVLLLLGSAIFFVITSLDSYYVRNLWSFYKEGRSGSWQDEPQLESLSPVEPENSAVAEVPAAGITADPILNAYAFSYNRPELLSATNRHHLLLQSNQPEVILSGLRVSFTANFPWFAKVLSQAVDHDNNQVRQFARAATEINQSFAKMNGYSSVFRRKIKSVALEILETPAESVHLSALKNLLNYPDHKHAELLVDALTDSRFKEFSSLIISCITEDGRRLSVTPIVDRMYACQYENAQPYRQLLEQLTYGKKSLELRAAIETNLATLKADELALGRGMESPDRQQLQKFMHTLFLEEYRLSHGKLDGALSDTIAEFQILSSDESATFIDMHLSFLKRSELFNAWQALMA